MSIQAAILGLLSWQPFSGYDLKKLFADSPVLPWSGNNNQIYRALVELLDDGLATNEVYHSASAPAKKIYSITERGRTALRDWLVSEPQAPEIRNSFLIRLAWADELGNVELDDLINRYENTVRAELAMQREQLRRGGSNPGRSPRELHLWDMIGQNLTGRLEHELAWLEDLRAGLNANQNYVKGVGTMETILRETNGIRWLECLPEETNCLASVQQALDLVAACTEHDTQHLLIHAENLPPAFTDLNTKLAGEVLQKFVNYQVRTAMILPADRMNQGRFREFSLEANRGQQFRFFTKRQDAVDWLVER